MLPNEDSSQAGLSHTDDIRLEVGVHILEMEGEKDGLPLATLRVGYGGNASLEVRVPLAGRTICLLRVRKAGLTLSSVSGSVSLRLHRFNAADLRHLFWRRRSDYKARMEVPGLLSITPLLAANGGEGRELKKSLSILRKFGFAVSSDNFQNTPGLFEAWPPEGKVPARLPNLSERPGVPSSVAVVLHLHYRDLWPEFAWCLGRFTRPFHLIVTVNEADRDFERDVRLVFPEAEIHVMENRGRDVGPFMELLRQGYLDRFDAVCKLHGKRSAVHGPRALLGHIWRRANLVDLVGSDSQVAHILRRLAEERRIGMIGSARFHFPNGAFDEEGVWGENRKTVRELIQRLGFDPEGRQAEYYAGTMFWIAAAPLLALRKLDLSISDFEVENGAIDGTLAHAMERLFGMLPGMIGQKLEDAPLKLDPARGMPRFGGG